MSLTTLAAKSWTWFWSDPWLASAQMIGALSLVREGARHLEGGLVIWIEQTPGSRFWIIWAKLMATLDYISVSGPRKPHAIRALYEWDRERKRVLRQPVARETDSTWPTIIEIPTSKKEGEDEKLP